MWRDCVLYRSVGNVSLSGSVDPMGDPNQQGAIEPLFMRSSNKRCGSGWRPSRCLTAPLHLSLSKP
jgi:hypothetical protein